ncbi:MAG: hypothetical protein C0515_10195 [Novosphingobium sp.]|nr:hypothetical protein [Novosphingobium sp.]MBX9645028.1 hypothetical protein [Novosphingobium sp.]
MSEVQPTTVSPNDAIKLADQLGAVILPALIGLGYGIYLFFSEGMKTTNGSILILLGLPTLLLTSAFRRSKWFLTPAYLLGVYMFGILGCAALGIAFSEKSGWVVGILALIWVILGWRLLAGVQRLRQN